ncbi:MAG: glucosyltransferase-I precursor [Ignavibacteria bacterium]|nr:MAG: glucosyltransferase-I precursor [Ignavibacteria bacterium]KAF0160475.1 MAG: glucosyltransferase-I precursor [Ignavibacteria bacterium]
MKPKITFLLVTGLTLLAFSCKEGITDSPVLVKSPLDMTWTVDTLAYPQSVQTLMAQVCAFSKKNIYLVGWSGLVGGEMYHYDGKKWQNVDISPQVGGHRVNRLLGLSPTNIWGVGYQGENDFIVHYNGANWQKQAITTKGNLQRIDGDAPNNIYAIGLDDAIYYYNGTKWNYEKVRLKIPDGVPFRWRSVAVFNGTTFLLGEAIKNDFAKTYMVTGKYKEWTVNDSLDLFFQENEKWGRGGFEKGGNGKLYSYGNYYFEYTSSGWKRLPQPNKTDMGPGFYVYNDNYMISLGRGIGYFDGVSWRSIDRFKNPINLIFPDAWTSGDELFIIANDFSSWPNKTIVFHGK